MGFFKRFRSKTCFSKLAISAAAVAVGAACPDLIGGAVVGGVLGGLGQNLLANVFDRWFPENSLPPSDHLNHDIELAVGHAIEGVVQELIDAGSPHRAAYQSLLRRDAAEVWRKMLIDEPCKLDPPDPQELLVAAAKAVEDARIAAEGLKPVKVVEFVKLPPALDDETWRKWLVRLAARLEGAKPIGDALDELAPALVDRFYWHLVQVLKTDSDEDGRAYAAIQMASIHSILAIVRDQSARLVELGGKIDEVVQRIEHRLDQIRVQLHPDEVRWFDERFGRLEKEVKEFREDFHVWAARIDAKLSSEESHRTEVARLRIEIDRRDTDIRSRDARIARLEAQLVEANRLAQEGDAEAEAALAYARKHDDISRVVELLDRITDRESERLRAQLAVQGGRIVDRRLESADYHFRKGDVSTGRARLLDAVVCAPREPATLSRIGRFAKAFMMFDVAGDAYQVLLRSTIDERWIAIAECDLGDVELAQGNRSSAIRRYRRSLDLDQRSLQRVGEKPEALRDMAVSLDRVGDMELAENGANAALPLYQKSLAIRRHIVARFGATPGTSRDVSVSLERVGDAELDENGTKVALPLYQESLAIRRQILERSGETTQALRDVSVSLDRVGDVEVAEKGAKAALSHYQESLKIRRRIVERFGETPETLRDVSVSLNNVGDVELTENGAKAALPLCQESLSIACCIVDRFGEAPQTLRDVSVALERVGDVERAENGANAALSIYQGSLAIRRRIVERFGETPEALRDVSVALNKVGNVERAENGPGAALPLYQESLAIRRRIVERFGETLATLRDVAVSLYRTADARAREGGVDAGLADAREALRLFEEVGRRWGMNWQIRKDIELTQALIAQIEGMDRPG